MENKLHILLVFSLALILSIAACTPQVDSTQAAAESLSTAAESSPAAHEKVESLPVDEIEESASDDPTPGGVFTRPLTSEPTGLDPHDTIGSGQNILLPYLFDTLVYRDQDNSFKPFLAKDWTISEDGKLVTFNLRQDVTFHDGTPLNAEAVQFTFQRFQELGAKNPLSGGIMQIISIEVLDEYTVQFGFEQPSSIFFGTLSLPYSGIISPTAAEEQGKSFAQYPVGSGPFKMQAWTPGVSITLARNPDYNWGPPVVENNGAPYLETIHFPVIPDAASQLAAFQAGEVDMLFVNSPDHIASLSQDENAQVSEIVLNSLVYLGFNCRKPPLDSTLVRQALSHAIDKEELLLTAAGGIGEVAFSPLAPTLPGFDPGLKDFELSFAPETSASLLREAGLTQNDEGMWLDDGAVLQLTLLTSTRSPNGDLAAVLQSQFLAAGIQVDIQQVDSSAAMKAAAAGEYDLFLWRYSWNDADVLNIYLGSDRIGRTNRQFYSNPDVDQLLNSAMVELNQDTRADFYIQAQEIILFDAPWQPLYNPKDTLAIHTSTRDVVIGTMGRVLLNDAYKMD